MKTIMKTITLLGASLLLGISAATAADTLQLVFRTAVGSEERFDAADLRMAVSDGTLLVSNGTVSRSLELASLDCMFFEGPTVGVEEVTAVSGNEPAAVYTVDGVMKGNYPTLNEALSNLMPGIYVVAQPGKTIKIQVK